MFEKGNLINPLDTFHLGWTKATSVDSFVQPSFFVNHSLPLKHPAPIIHYTAYDYSTALIMFFAFALLVWLYVVNTKFISQLLKSFYTVRFANQFTREENSIINRTTIALLVMFLMLATLFVAKIIMLYHIIEIPNYNLLFLKIGLVITFACAIKIISVRLLGFIFQNTKEASDYITVLVLFWNSLALFLFPLLCCLLFLKQINSQSLITAGSIGIGLLLIIRFGKTILLGLNSTRISKVYLFLYLCTLEILPFIILYKLFLINTNL